MLVQTISQLEVAHEQLGDVFIYQLEPTLEAVLEVGGGRRTSLGAFLLQ